jgi:hypothetical protein
LKKIEHFHKKRRKIKLLYHKYQLVQGTNVNQRKRRCSISSTELRQHKSTGQNAASKMLMKSTPWLNLIKKFWRLIRRLTPLI